MSATSPTTPINPQTPGAYPNVLVSHRPCLSARASLMTGLYAHEHHMFNNSTPATPTASAPKTATSHPSWAAPTRHPSSRWARWCAAWREAQGLYERTAILFTVDHGDMAGEHGFLSKGASHVRRDLPHPAAAQAPAPGAGDGDRGGEPGLEATGAGSTRMALSAETRLGDGQAMQSLAAEGLPLDATGPLRLGSGT